MKSLEKALSLFCAMAICLLCCTVTAGAAADNLQNPDGDIIGISNRGDWHGYPENSLEAILSAAKTGIGGVLADVSITKDGTAVLLEANSVSRMLSGAESDAVCDYTLEEIQSFKLKEACGGQNNAETAYTVSTLENALKETANMGIILVLKTAADNAEAVINTIAEYPDTVIYLTGKQSKVKAALKNYGKSYTVITEKRGNIVFNQTAFVDFAGENGAEGIVLKTTNRYGVNFNQTVLKHFYGKLRAIADTSDSTLAGAREDTEKWWDDLISRGYSVIITNDPQGFADYISSNSTAREKLGNAYEKYTTQWQLPEFASQIFNDYKKAYTDAVTEAESLLTDRSSSTQAMNDCYSALVKSCDDIDMNYTALEEGKAGLSVSLPRILLCAGAVIVVVAIQIFFFRRREKN